MLSSLILATCLTGAVFSAPTATAPVVPSQITSEAQLESVIAGLEEDGVVLAAGASVLVGALEAIVPSPAPASIPDAISSVASVYAAHPTDFFVSAFDLVLNGLAPQDLVEDALAESPYPENSSNNINLINPVPAIYPKKGANDAPYSFSETTLRGAMYIPPQFTYGKVPPVILIPGTAATGGENFGANFGKLFEGSDYADPVYLTIPGEQLNDIQLNSEYIAYAINYISAISGHKNISTLSWSAGSLGGQWAMTYWPSTRSVVSNVINISGDLHGTVLAYFLCPPFPEVPCAPSVLQVWLSLPILMNETYTSAARIQLNLHRHNPKCRWKLSIRSNNQCIQRLRRDRRTSTTFRRISIRPRRASRGRHQC